MRKDIPRLLAVGIFLAACEDGEAPSRDGMLVVSTVTRGEAPDQDGYLLAIDGSDSVPLDPTGSAELSLPAGRYTLTLVGVAAHCSVTERTSLEVDVPSQATVSVTFEVSCPAGAVRVTTTTTGVDQDPDGYHVVIDGADHGSIPANATLVTDVNPGTRTITLTGVAPLCAIDGPDSRTVTVTGLEPLSIEFVIVCTAAASGVIGVMVETSGSLASAWFEVMIDGAAVAQIGWGGPHYVDDVPGGDHVVSLHHRGFTSCSVETDPREVTITVGGPVRDTAEVSFSVTCEPEPSQTVRITAPTAGAPPTAYRVSYEHFDAWGYGGVVNHLGGLEPNGTLLVDLPVSNSFGGDPYWYRFYLADVPGTCRADDPNPSQGGFTIAHGDTLEVEFAVRCSP